MQQDKSNNEQEVQVDAMSLAGKFKSLPTLKKISIISFLLIMLCVMIFIIFFTGKPSLPPKPQIKVADIKLDTEPVVTPPVSPNLYPQPSKSDNVVVDKVKNKVSDLKPPTPPKLDIIEAPKPTLQSLPIKPQQVIEPKLPLPNVSQRNTSQQNNQKQSTNIMAFGGTDGSKSADNNKSDTQTKNSNFLGFDGGMIDNTELQPTSAQPIIATKINNDLKYTLLQGKVVDAVLETAINTQMTAGIVRAIISRDIYGEQGELVLIPKGSRVIGSYTVTSSSGSSSQTGQVSTRVYAVWKRIITPSGVDINLPDMPAADPLGRSGIPGFLDTNLSNNLINAFLVSVLGPYLATVASGASKQTTTATTNNSSGGSIAPVGAQTTTTGTVGAQVLTQGLQQFQSVAQGQINAVYPPGIITTFVNQGTKIDIIIQQDIAFPKQSMQLHTQNLP